MPIRFPGDAHTTTLDDLASDVDNVKTLSVAATAIYGGFHRLAWAVAIGWVTFACCRGYGGIIFINFGKFIYDNV